MSMQDLKPCPFCGGEPMLEIGGGRPNPWTATLCCHECGALISKESISGATIELGAVTKKVKEAWNKRYVKTAVHNFGLNGFSIPKNCGLDEYIAYLESVTENAAGECVDYQRRVLGWLRELKTLQEGEQSADTARDKLTPPPENRVSFSAGNGNKSVNLTFNPSNHESAKAAETWVRALFSERGDCAEDVKDSDVIRLSDDELLKRVKNAPLTADGTTATQPEPEPDVLEFDRLRDELVDPLPFDVIGLWGQVAEYFLEAHEQARAAWKEGKRARIPYSMIDALKSLSKRLSADLEKSMEMKPEPAKPDKNSGEMTAAEHLKFVCDGLKAEPRRNIMDIAGSAYELRNIAKPLLAYLDKYGCDEYTGVTVTRDAVIVGKTPHTDALLFEAKFPNCTATKRRKK